MDKDVSERPRNPAHRRPDKTPLVRGIIEDALRRDGDGPHPSPGTHGPLSAPASRASQVMLLDIDRELADAVPPEALPRARHALRAIVNDFDAGPVTLHGAWPDAFALVVVAGAVNMETRLSTGGRIIELLLPGDVVSPRPPSFGLPEHEVRYVALEAGLRVAALDRRFVEAAAVWPELMVVVHQRLHDQMQRLAVHSAICQLPRIEDRVIAMLSHLAALIGKVTPDGVIVPLSLRHEDLAAYVGARRPSVSLAIKMLRAQGLLDRRADDTWVLPAPLAAPEAAETGAVPLGD